MDCMEIEVVVRTRRCIAKYKQVNERTEDELCKMYDELPADNAYKCERGTGFEGFSKNNGRYNVDIEEECIFHMFSQETEENSDGNMQYPVAIIELKDGTVKIVYAENIKFIKEDVENE